MKTHPFMTVLGLIATTLASGCGEELPSEVAVSGFLVASPSEEGVEQRVAGARATALSRDGQMSWGQARTRDDGFFSIDGLPPSEPIALTFTRDDADDPRPPAVFTGSTSQTDLTIFLGLVFMPPLEAMTEQIADYRNAPGAPEVLEAFTLEPDDTEHGGMVRGRVIRWIRDADGMFFESVPEATVELVSTADEPHPICYRAEPASLDSSGAADCEREETSSDSRFAAFGLPPGPAELHVSTPTFGDVTERILVVEGGVTHLDFFAVDVP